MDGSDLMDTDMKDASQFSGQQHIAQSPNDDNHLDHDDYDYDDEDDYDEDDDDEVPSKRSSPSLHGQQLLSGESGAKDSSSKSSTQASTASDQAAPAKKKRLAQACDNCRRRKVKCDGVRPSCNKCIQLRIQCAYQPRNQKRKQRQGYIEKLENRLLEMERLLRTQTEAANAAAAVAAAATDPNMATQFAQMSGAGGLAGVSEAAILQQAMFGIMQDYNAPPPDLDLRLASIPGLLSANNVGGNDINSTARLVRRLSSSLPDLANITISPSGQVMQPDVKYPSAMLGGNNLTASHNSHGNNSNGHLAAVTAAGLPGDLNPLLAAWMTEVPQAVSNNLTVDPGTLSLLNASSQAAAASADLLLLNPRSTGVDPLNPANLLSHSPSPSMSPKASVSPSPPSQTRLSNSAGSAFLNNNMSPKTPPPPPSMSHIPSMTASAASIPIGVHATMPPANEPIGNATYLPPVPDDLLKHLLSLFFTFCYPLGPMIHPPTFYKQLAARRVSPLLLWTMCANAARYSDHPTLQANHLLASGEFFAQRAKEHLVISQSSPKVHGIQGVLFLGIFEYAQGRASTAWVYMGMATRMAQSLKLHRLDDPVLVARRQGQPEDWVTQETKRRTWWVCYLIDRTGAMAAGVPSAIDSRDMAVSLPSPDPDWEVGANPTEHPGVMMGPSDTRAFLEMEPGAQFGLTEDTRFSRYAYMLQLCTIMGRVNQFVIRPRLGYITPEENAEFEHLDALLAAWSKTLPSSLSFSPNDILQRSIGENRYTTHAMCLHTFHNVTVALLHRARYRSLTGKQPDAFTTMTVNATAPLGSGAIVAADVSGSTPEMLESIEKMPGQNPADLSLLRCVQSALSVAQIAQQGLGRVAIRCHVLQPFCYLTCAIILIRCLESPVEVNNPMRAAAQDGFIVLLNALRECRPYWRLSETYLAILTSLATKLILPATLQTTTTAATTPTIATS